MRRIEDADVAMRVFLALNALSGIGFAIAAFAVFGGWVTLGARVFVVSVLFVQGLRHLSSAEYEVWINNGRVIDRTAGRGGRWRTGKIGTRVFHGLQALAGIGFVMAAVSWAIGWMDSGAYIMIGAVLVSTAVLALCNRPMILSSPNGSVNMSSYDEGDDHLEPHRASSHASPVSSP